MFTAEPAQVISNLVNVAMLTENVGGGKTVIAADRNAGHLRSNNAGKNRAVVRELIVRRDADERIIAVQSGAEFVEQGRAERVSIMQRPVADLQALVVGRVGSHIAALELEVAVITEIAEIERVPG